MPGPWTLDPVLAEYRFCNVHREDDRTTKWFRENVRRNLDHHAYLEFGPEEAVLGVTAFRWFNRIETAELILPMLREGLWDRKTVQERLRARSPLVTGAYMIKTPAGMNKLDGICDCMMNLIILGLHREAGSKKSLEETWETLREAPYLGDFMAYEIVSDLRWIGHWQLAPDIMTWANPGPGAARGLGWITDDHPLIFNRHSKAHRQEMQGLMMWLLNESQKSENWPSEWPRWEMREVEHWLCEFDKWCRATYNGQSLKRRYRDA